MSFTKGQNVVYSTLDNRKFNGKIIERKIDFTEKYIKTFNAQGNFDYLIEINRNGKIEHIFCSEKDLT